MPKPSVQNSNNYFKIGKAAKLLGVSIDTLRRWEKKGKITAIRTAGGTRLYHVSTLKSINPTSVEHHQATSLSTEDLLKKVKAEESAYIQSEPTAFNTDFTPFSPSESKAQDSATEDETALPSGARRSFINKFLIGTAATFIFTLLITSWITASYLTQPKTAQQFFQNSVASKLLSPFETLAQEAVMIISPSQAKLLGFVPPDERPPLATSSQLPAAKSNVLAVTASSQFLEVNTDTQINGSLFVRDSINGLSLEATPSAGTMTLTSGSTQLNVINNATLDQDVSTASSPTFNTLNLSATNNQIVFQSGGPAGTLTWTPTAARTITLPDATTTVVGTNNTQTLTNKTINGSDNTISNIANSALSNSKVTVTAGTNLTGGGDISLGSSATVSLKDSVSLAGTLAVTGATTLSSTVTVSGIASGTGNTVCVNTSNQLVSCTTGAAISGSGTTNYIPKYSSSTVLGNSSIFDNGNVGIGTSVPSQQFQVNSGANSVAITSAGNLGIGTTSPSGAFAIGNSFVVTSAGLITAGTWNGSVIPVAYGGTGVTSLSSLLLSSSIGTGSSGSASGLEVVSDQLALVQGCANGQMLKWDGNNWVCSNDLGAYAGVINVGVSSTAPFTDIDTLSLDANDFNATKAVSTVNISIDYANSQITRKNQNEGISGIWQFTGNIGIGATATNTALSVLGNLGIGVSATSSNLAVNGSSVLGWGTTAVTGPANGLAVLGNVGIGTTTAAYNLAVVGSVNVGTLSGAGLNSCSASDSKLLYNATTNTFSCGTDAGAGTGVTGSGYIGGIGIFDTSSRINTSPFFYFDSANTRLGIGTSAPSQRFQVNLDASNPVVITSAGNVGIGFTTPTSLFQVNSGSTAFTVSSAGNVGIGGSLTVSSAPVFSTLGTGVVTSNSLGGLSSGPLSLSSGASYISGILPVGNGGTGTSTQFTQGAAIFAGASGAYSQSPANFFWDSTNSRLGIGTSSPNNALDITSTSAPQLRVGYDTSNYFTAQVGSDGAVTLDATGTGAGFNVADALTLNRVADATALSVVKNSNLLTLQGAYWNGATSTNVTGDILLTVNDDSPSQKYGLTFKTNSQARAYLDQSGNFGIGTTDPASALDVRGDITLLSGSSIQPTADGVNALGIANAAGTNYVYFDTTNSRVGIGNSAPSYSLDVLNSARFRGNIIMDAASPTITFNDGQNLNFNDAASNTLLSLIDSGTYGTLRLSAKNTAGDPATCTAGDIYFNSNDQTFKACTTTNTWKILDNTGNVTGSSTRNGQVSFWNDTNSITGSDSFFWNSSTSRLGVGYSSPAARLHVLSATEQLRLGYDNDNYFSTTVGAAGAVTFDAAGAGASFNFSDALVANGAATFNSTATFGSTASLANGSSTTPSLNFTNSTGSGLWRMGTNKIGLQTGGVLGQGITIDANGNVGIGYTNPSQIFQVNADTSNPIVITSGGNLGIGFTTPTSLFQVNSGSTAFTVSNTGNVGIGASLNVTGLTTLTGGLTVGNNNQFQVNSTGSVFLNNISSATGTAVCINSSNSLVTCSGGSSISGTGYGDSNGGGITFYSGSNTISSSPFFFWDNTNSRMGIGTSAPSQEFQVNTNTANPFVVTSGGNVGIGFTSPTAALDVRGVTSLKGSMTTTGLTVTGAGYIGIGITSPTNLLDINGGMAIGSYAGTYAAPSNGLIISGNVGIGTSVTSLAKLTLATTNAIAGGGLTNCIGTSKLLYNASTGLFDCGTDSGSEGGGISGTGYTNANGGGVSFYSGASTISYSPFFYWDNTNSRLGIGTSAPSQEFQVNTNTANPIVLTSGGNIGIGTTSPASALQINSGQIFVPNGTASAPSYSFSNSTSTGMYSPAVNTLALSTNGIAMPALFISSVGNVGIGTTNTGTRLTLPAANAISGAGLSSCSDNSTQKLLYNSATGLFECGTDAGGGGVGISGSGYGDTNGGGISFYSGSSTVSYSPLFHWDNANSRLGIGTSAPSQTFQVNLNTGTPFVVTSNGNVGVGFSTPTSRFQVNSGPTAFTVSSTGNVGIGASLTTTGLGVFNGGLSATTIQTTGNVGIGGSLTVSSAPVFSTLGTGVVTANSLGGLSSGPLSLSSGTSYISGILPIANGGTNNSSAYTSGAMIFSDGSKLTQNPANIYWDNANSRLGIGTSNPGGSLIVASGNVGVGFTTPDRSLQVASDIDITGSLSSLLGANGTQFAITGNSATGTTDKLALGVDTTNHYGVIQAGTPASAYNLSLQPGGGNVGIGTTSPLSALDIRGNVTLSTGSYLSPVSNSTTALNIANSSGTSFVVFDTTNQRMGIGLASAPESTLSIGGTTTLLRTADAESGSITKNSNLLTLQGAYWNGASSTNVTGGIYLKVNGTDPNYGLSFQTNSQDRFFINQAGNVGIGTTSPTSALDVRGDITLLSGSSIQPTADGVNALGIANAAGTNYVYFDTTNSRVGIGNSAPSYSLDVLNSARFRGNIIMDAASPTITFNDGQNLNFNDAASNTLLSLIDSGAYGTLRLSAKDTTTNPGTCTAGDIYFNSADNTFQGCTATNTWKSLDNASTGITGTGGFTGGVAYFDSTNTIAENINHFWDNTNNRLGVGTSGPSAKLDVIGTIEQLRLGYDSSNYFSTTVSNTGAVTFDTTGAGASFTLSDPITASSNLTVGGVASLANGSSTTPSLNFTNSTGAGLWRMGTNKIGLQTGGVLGQGITIDANGNVGIGYTNPSQIFQVNADTSNPIVITSGGNLGIGFTTPTSLFQINSGRTAFTVSSTGNVGVGASLTTTSLGLFNGGISVSGLSALSTVTASTLTTSGNVGVGASITGFGNLNGLNVSGLTSLQGLNATTINASTLTTTGNIGIGATTSSNRLDVWGTTRLAGTLAVDSTSTFGGSLTLSNGQFLAPNGTSSAPSYSFSGSTTTGLYAPAAGVIGFTVNGTGEVGRISSAGLTLGEDKTAPTVNTVGSLTLIGGGNNANYVTLTAPTPLNNTQTYYLPDNYPASTGMVLSSATNGVLSWTSAGGNLSASGGTQYMMTRFNSATALVNSSVFDNGSLIGLGFGSNTYNVGIGTTNLTARFQVGYPTANSLSANLTGELLDLQTNLTATGYSVTGQSIWLPTVTNTGAGTYTYTGVSVGGNNESLTQNNASGTTNWYGLDVAMPTVTQTNGTMKSIGLRITGPAANPPASSYAITVASGIGNVGIGDETPASLFTVGNGDLFQINSSGLAFLPNGAAATPSLSFVSDIDTGLFRPASDNLGIGTSGVERIRLDQNGNIGIGTTSPSQLFQVNYSSTNPVVITSAGNLGIGFTTPTSLFQVNSGSTAFTVSNTGNVGIGASLTTTGVTLANGGLQVSGLTNLTGNVGIGGSLTLNNSLKLSNYNCASLSNGGKLTTDSSGNLTCSADTAASVTGGATGGVTIWNSDTSLSHSVANFYWNSTSNYLGLGTSNPTALLHVGSSTVTPPLYIPSATGNVGIGTTGPSQLFQVNSSTSNPVVITSAGNVGIGFTTPTSLFQINSGRTAFTVSSTGNVGVGASLTTTSLGLFNGGISVSGLSALSTVTASTLTTSGNVGVGASITGFGNLNGLNVSGLTSLQGLNATTINATTLTTTGNIGIGATTSSNKLDVWGNARITGTLTVDSTATIGTGAAATPGLNFVGDTDTGIYNAAANVIGFAVNGSEMARLNSTGLTLGEDKAGGTPNTAGYLKLIAGGDNAYYTTFTTSSSQSEAQDYILPLAKAVSNGMVLSVSNTTTGQLEWVTGGGISGNGTQNWVVKYDTGGSSLTNSSIFDNGTITGVGATNATSRLTVGYSSSINGQNANAESIILPAITNSDGSTYTYKGLAISGGTLTHDTVSGTDNWYGVDITTPVLTQTTGAVNSIGLRLKGSVGSTGTAYAITTDANAGNVGIGDETPASLFTVGNGDLFQINSSGLVRLPDGAATTPSLSFVSDIDTGLFRPASDNLGIGTSGAERIRINANGNVGIGTTSPSQLFQVNYSSSNPLVFTSGGNLGIGFTTPINPLVVNGAATIGAANLNITAPANGLFVDGSVGIGATTSSNKLDVWGNTRLAGTLALDNSLTLADGQFLAPDGLVTAPAYSFANDTDTGLWRKGANFLALTTGGTHYSGQTITGLSINANGNVGIGTTNPTHSLHVVAGGNSTDAMFDGRTYFKGTNAITFEDSSGTQRGYMDAANNYVKIQTVANGSMRFITSGNKIGLIVLDSGNVGIGSSAISPVGALQVGPPGAEDAFFVGNTGNIGIGTTSPTALLQIQSTNPVVITSSGNLGIGFTTPDRALQLASDIDITGSLSSLLGANGTQFSITGNSATGTTDKLALGMDTTNHYGVIQAGTTTSAYDLFLQPGGGNVGIGNTTPLGKLSVTDTSNTAASFTLINNTATTIGNGANTLGVLDLQSTSLTTGNFMNIELNGLTSGKGINLTSTSTAFSSGYLMNLNWNPGTATVATGDLLNIGVGSSGSVGNLLNLTDNSSSIFAISQTGITASIPTSFTAPGDVSIAYDINFTNPTASYIKSAAPLYLVAGEVFNSSDLVLQTYNFGNLILNPNTGNLWADGTNVGIGTTAPAAKFQVNTGSSATVITSSGNIGIGATTANSNLYVNGGAAIGANFNRTAPANGLIVQGNVGIGFTTPDRTLQIAADITGLGNTLGTILGSSGSQLSLTGSTANTLNEKLALGIDTTNDVGFIQAGASLGVGNTPAYTLALNPLGGNVGIGTSTANSLLSISGNAHIGSLYQGIAAPTDGLFVDGNLGIGATTSSNKLDVWGNSRLAGTLAVDSTATLNGNVGIGKSAPVYNLDLSGSARLSGSLLSLGNSSFSNLATSLYANKNLGPTGTDSWSTGTAGGTTRNSAASVFYNGKIYIWGGSTTSVSSGVVNTMSIYDVTSGTWSSGTSGGTGRWRGTATAYNGKIYINSGITSSNAVSYIVDIYDIASDTWSTGTSGSHAYATFPTASLYNGKIYIWGGAISTVGANNLAIYDIANNSWSTGTAGGTGRWGHTSVVYNGKIYSWGGAINNTTYTTALDIYDIASDTWSTGASGGSNRRTFKSALYNGKIYSWGGWNGTTALNTVDIYDIASNTWSTGTAGGTGRSQHVSALYNDKIYSWAGSTDNATALVNTVDIYSIGTNQNIMDIQENGTNVLTLETGRKITSWGDLVIRAGTTTNNQLYLATSGNVGISTTAPSQLFQINNSANNPIVMTSGGNVGIGFTTPDRRLQLASDIDITGSLASLLGANGTQFAITGNSATGTTDKLALGIDTTNHYGVIQAGTTASAYNLSLQPGGGNVGIGTTSPTALLHVQGTGSMPSLLVTTGGNVGIGTSVTSNPLTVGVDGSTGNGAFLSAGGAWTDSSSRSFKENFTNLNDQDLLSKISQLEVLQWNYKVEDPSVKHIGPIAEDFYAIFGVGNDAQHISALDTAGVALAGIKAQSRQIGILDEKISSAQKEISNIKYQISNIENIQATAEASLETQVAGILAKQGLVINADGTLNVPKLNTGSITLDPSLASVSAGLNTDSSLSVIPNGVRNLPSLENPSLAAQDDKVFYDLAGTIASLEERLKNNDLRFKNLEAEIINLKSSIINQESTPSAQIAGIQTSSSSADLIEATTSAQPKDKQATDSATPVILANTSASLSVNSVRPESSSAIDSGVANAPQNDSASSAQIATSSAEASASATTDYGQTTNSDLNLTPPDILLNQASATLTDLSVKSEATFSGQLTAYDLTAQNSFKSLGQTTLGTTTIAGNLTVDGMLSIENGNEINAIGTLFLQKSSLADNLDIFSGKVTITKDGTLQVATIVANQIKVNQNTSAGSGTILAGQTDVIIENPYVEGDSIILLTPKTPLAQTMAVADQVKGGFLVKILYPEVTDIKFDYLIIGVKN